MESWGEAMTRVRETEQRPPSLKKLRLLKEGETERGKTKKSGETERGARGTKRKEECLRILPFFFVRAEGLEPPSREALDPKSSVSTNFTTPATNNPNGFFREVQR